MAALKIKDIHVKPAVFTASLIFLILAVTLFTPFKIPLQICLPAGILCIASLWLTPWEITLALLFSAAGDLAGDCGNLIAQMGSFTVAHIFYIIFFIRRFFRKGTKMTAKMKGFLMMLGICICSLLILIFARVVPSAPAGIIRIGAGIYAVIICIMLLTALFQRSSLYALGAMLFVISDFALAWNMFIESSPYANIVILSTYYAAQWLLFIRATPYRIAHPVHLMRF
ncbi:MAG: lysoplasmalogenase [Bacteroidales bacterium]|nr:lysoplasmalogenase [Bacteroidales bacterium]